MKYGVFQFSTDYAIRIDDQSPARTIEAENGVRATERGAAVALPAGYDHFR